MLYFHAGHLRANYVLFRMAIEAFKYIQKRIHAVPSRAKPDNTNSSTDHVNKRYINRRYLTTQTVKKPIAGKVSKRKVLPEEFSNSNPMKAKHKKTSDSFNVTTRIPVENHYHKTLSKTNESILGRFQKSAIS